MKERSVNFIRNNGENYADFRNSKYFCDGIFYCPANLFDQPQGQRHLGKFGVVGSWYNWLDCLLCVVNKRQKLKRLGEGILQIRDHGKPLPHRKDGGKITKPIIPCPDVLEAEVLASVMKWLKRNRIQCDRNNVGSGDLDNRGAIHSYGIKSGGDIIGLLPSGIHFEIECKRGRGGSLSLGQQERRDLIRKNKGVYLVIHGVAELELLMRGLL